MSKTYEMKEVLDKLTGNICAYGDTNIDRKVLENIDDLEEFLVSKINQLCTNYRLKDRNEYSIKEVAKKSEEVLERIKYTIGYYENKEE